ncbi:MAG: 2-oxoacid:acceptor oxidoreductase family protein, partial [Planctomycetaceae bacterium]|nr:2-oxoacid:acceptor oxidoreductase family protein [Planctomycetaceae bacterium]
NPMMSGVVQNQDSYMKGKIAQRWYYDRVGPAIREAFDLFGEKTGRRYDFVMPYLCDDADYIIVGMGCYMETVQHTVDHIRKTKGIKVGCLNVCVFRPFPSRQIVDALKNCKAFAVLERMDDPLSTTGNHLTREIKAAFCDAATGQNGLEKIDRIPQIHHGSAGLGSRDVRPGDIIAVVDNMIEEGQDYFCIGIDHALALKVTNDPDLRPAGTFSMRGHSVGGFGSVTTNKVIATIAGDVFGKDVQAYPKYGSEKKGLPTTYYLTIAADHVMLHSELKYVDLVVLNDTTALFSGNPLVGLMPGGSVVMQSSHGSPEEVWQRIPEHHKRTIRERKLKIYYADMVQIAREVASVADLQMRMQGIVLLGGFLKLMPYGSHSGMNADQVYAGVEKALRKYFGKRGEQVVQDNLTCVRRGYEELREVSQEIIQREAVSV